MHPDLFSPSEKIVDGLKKKKGSRVGLYISPANTETDFHFEHKVDQRYQIGNEQEGRLQTWVQLLEKHRHVLDVSPPGTGKSYAAGLLSPAMFGPDVQKIIYMTGDPRNPPTETLKNWPHISGRHQGLIRDGEYLRVKRAKSAKSDEGFNLKELLPNCDRTKESNLWSSHRLHINVCDGCIHYQSCNNGTHKHYNYLHKKAEALAAKQFRTHPMAVQLKDLPSEKQSVVLVFEEAGALICTESFDVTQEHINATQEFLKQHDLNLSQRLEEFFNSIWELIHKKPPNKYGHDTNIVHSTLSPKAIVLDDREVKGFQESLKTFSKKKDNKLLQNWLIDCLRILGKNEPGSVRINSKGLSITLPPQRIRDLIRHKSVRAVLLLDASGWNLRKLLDIDEDLYTIAVEQKENVPRRIQIVGFGKLSPGAERSPATQSILDKLKDDITTEFEGQVGIIDFKKYKQACNEVTVGSWFVDNRSSNQWKTAKCLILIGAPIMNIGALEAEYRALGLAVDEAKNQNKVLRSYIVANGDKGKLINRLLEDPSDGFACYLHRKVQAEFMQAEGRLRSNRRDGEKLTVFFITDYPTGLHIHEWTHVSTGRKIGQELLKEKNRKKSEECQCKVSEAMNKIRNRGDKVTVEKIKNETKVMYGKPVSIKSVQKWRPVIEKSWNEL